MPEAIGAMRAGLAWLAAADAAALPADTLADAVRALVQAESLQLAARSRFLSAFNSRGAFEADGQVTTRAWLHWQTRITRGAAGAGVAWMKRLAVHPRVADALAVELVSVSWARQVCDWTDELPPELRDAGDEILLTAAAGGADLADLTGLARQMYERTAPPAPDDGPPPDDDGFNDRQVRLDLHYRGAGHLQGNLTPECAAFVSALLDALGKKAGPEDDRTPGQRNHDALEEAARMLLATGTLPDVAGQPAHVLLHASLDQIQDLMAARAEPTDPARAAPEASPAAGEADQAGRHGPGQSATADSTGAFAAGRAAGDGEPGWLATWAARAYACDAKIATVVTGHIDPEVVAAAVREYLSRQDASGGPPGDGPDDDGSPPSGAGPASGAGPGASGAPPGAGHGREILRATLARYAVAMLSGPVGLASALRSGLPGPLGAGISLPLDITSPTATVPPHLRRAVIVRDRHCAFPGCSRQPARCHVHHLTPRSEGGATVLTNLVLLCGFHHLYLIHRQGWILTLHPDGTTTAVSPDGRKTLHSHGPPGAAAA